jgi:hypothetical protein
MTASPTTENPREADAPFDGVDLGCGLKTALLPDRGLLALRTFQQRTVHRPCHSPVRRRSMADGRA